MPIDASDQIWMDGTLVPWDEALEEARALGFSVER